jgi:hypothetical protein
MVLGKARFAQRARSPEAIVVLAGVLASFAIWPLREDLSALPGVLYAATLILYLVPGFLATRWSLGERFSGVATLPVGFVFSTGLFGMLGVPILMAHRSLDLYLFICGAVVAAFLLVAAFIALTRGRPVEIMSGAGKKVHLLLWVPFVASGAVLAYASRMRVPHSYNDLWVYLAYVREFLSTETLARFEPYFGNETGASRVRINGWLLEQAALARVSGIDPIDLVLRYLNPTVVVLALLAAYALMRLLLKNEAAALVAATVYALFFLLYLGPNIYVFGGEFITRAVEDKFTARFLFLPVSLYLAAAFLESRKLRYVIFFGFVCWSVVAVHPVGLAIIGLSVTGFGLVHLAVEWRSRVAWRTVISLGAALLSILVLPLLFVVTTGEPLSAVLKGADINAHDPEVLANAVFVRPGWQRILLLGGGYYMMHPALILNPVIALAYLAGLPFLFWRVRTSLAARLLLGVLLLVTVVCFFPPLTTFVGDHVVLPGQIWRLAWPISLAAPLIVGWMAWEGARYMGKILAERNWRPGLAPFLPLALVCVLTVAVAPAAGIAIKKVLATRSVPQAFAYPLDPAFRWMRDNIDEPAVVFAPDLENTVIPAHSAEANVASLRGNLILSILPALEERVPGEIERPQGALDVNRFFASPNIPEAASILRRYEADYLLLKTNTLLDERLLDIPGFTQIDVPGGRYSLYGVDREKLAGGERED